MIDVHCPDCGRVLVGTRQIISMTNQDGEDGIEMVYVCWCGRVGAELIRRRSRRRGRAIVSTAGNATRPSGVWR